MTEDRAISLNAVIEAIDVWDSYAKTIERIKELPPVKPQDCDICEVGKTGHWIEGGYDDYKLVCSECGYPRYEYYEKPKAKYCECCGCPMEIEPQEGANE